MKQILVAMLSPISSPRDVFELITRLIVALCLTALVAAVVVNFATAERRGRESQVRRSPVATGSMTLVLAGICLLINRHIGVIAMPNLLVKELLVVPGLLLMVTGVLVNLLGRVRLGKNWANQATIYANQTLITTGIFALVRHPLYASLIWMCYGGALIYQNAAALCVTLAIFYPMMVYRAGLEETMLSAQFPDYAAYRARVGRFFPRGKG